ncbi:F0F1 ATP synthase subunit B [bacterium]|nr:F0F1 ATP synthase subunit B [bacterium]
MTRTLFALAATLVLVIPFTAFAADDHATPSKDKPAAAAHGNDAHGADAGHGAEGGHGTPSLIPLKPEEMAEQAPLAIWTVVVFLVLLGLATKFGWKPIVAAMHDREHHLQAVLEDTEKARNEAEGLLRQYKAEMASASDKIKSLLDEARRDASTTAQEIVGKAQAESESLKDRAQKEIVQARDEALVQIWSKAADVSVQVAGKVLQKSLTPEEHKRLVEISAAELPDASAFGISGVVGSKS